MAFGWLILVTANHAYAESQGKKPQAEQAVASPSNGVSAADYDLAEAAPSPDKQTEPCEPGDDRRYSDLCAQWKAADAAADSAWWAWVASIASIVGTGAVLVAIWLAYQANHIARDTAKRQLRAYITMEKGHCLNIIVGQRPQFDLCVKNTGQTPAKNFRGTAAAVIRPKDWKFEVADPNEWGGESDIVPSCQFQFLASVTNPITIADMIQLESGDMVVFVCVRGVYVDIFGEPHRFTMSHMVSDISTGSIRPCATGNTAT